MIAQRHHRERAGRSSVSNVLWQRLVCGSYRFLRGATSQQQGGSLASMRRHRWKVGAVHLQDVDSTLTEDLIKLSSRRVGWTLARRECNIGNGEQAAKVWLESDCHLNRRYNRLSARCHTRSGSRLSSSVPSGTRLPPIPLRTILLPTVRLRRSSTSDPPPC
jgi:hypothetical protein